MSTHNASDQALPPRHRYETDILFARAAPFVATNRFRAPANRYPAVAED